MGFYRSPLTRRDPTRRRASRNHRSSRAASAESPEQVTKVHVQKRRKQRSGPHTPEMDRAVTPEEPPPDSPVNSKTTNLISDDPFHINRKIKPDDSVIVAPVVAIPSVMAELVVAATADSNTP